MKGIKEKLTTFWKIRRLRKALEIEMIETMCTICLYLEEDGHRHYHNRYSRHFRDHFITLKGYSEVLRHKYDIEESASQKPSYDWRV